MFDIKIGDRLVIRNFDIIKEGGNFTAIDRYHQLELTNDQEIYFDDELCYNAYKSEQ